MRPKEFVARVIDLFEFDLGEGGGWQALRPSNFSAAALCINMNNEANEREVSGYGFKLEAQECLGHTVVRATMTAVGMTMHGSICFTYHEYDTMPPNDDVPLHEHIHESWDLSRDLRERPEDIASMLTFLTLKTDYRIKHKRFPA